MKVKRKEYDLLKMDLTQDLLFEYVSTEEGFNKLDKAGVAASLVMKYKAHITQYRDSFLIIRDLCKESLSSVTPVLKTIMKECDIALKGMK
jgi:hypothetical protein